MIFSVSHSTQYDYDAPVGRSFAEVRQLPADVDGQVCLRREIATQPSAEFHREHRDYFGNLVATVSIDVPHTQLIVTSSSLIDTSGRPSSFDSDAQRPWSSFTASNAAPGDLDAVEFSLDSPLIDRSSELAEYAEPSFGLGASLVDGVSDLCRRIHQDFEFDPGATDVDTPISEVMALRRGVCQDFAHLMIGALRSVGLPACYVSGYLETKPPPGQPRLAGADRTHAWVGIYLGSGRWIGIDPTNDQIAGSQYVTAAHGRDYSDVTPLKGVIFTSATTSTLSVSVDVAPQQQSQQQSQSQQP